MPNWKLVDQDTRAELAIGDERTTCRNGPVRIDRLQPPDEPGSTGRVYVRFDDGSKSSGLFPSVVNAEFVDLDGGPYGTKASACPPFKIPTAWREKKITLNEAEDLIARHARRKVDLPSPGTSAEITAKDREDLEEIAAKYHQAAAEQWKRMKRQIEPEVSLWTFSTPSEDWIRRAGMYGIALFRHDEFLSHVALVWG